jgi:glutathione S-transferase
MVLLEESLPLDLNPEAAHGSTGTVTQHPFQRGPILIDDDFIVVESPDILNSLKAKPNQAPVSIAPHRLSRVRAMDMVPLRKLVDIVMPRLRHQLSCHDGSTPQQTSAKQQALTLLRFFEELLQAWPAFGRVPMILAEVVLGATVLRSETGSY